MAKLICYPDRFTDDIRARLRPYIPGGEVFFVRDVSVVDAVRDKPINQFDAVAIPLWALEVIRDWPEELQTRSTWFAEYLRSCLPWIPVEIKTPFSDTETANAGALMQAKNRHLSIMMEQIGRALLWWREQQTGIDSVGYVNREPPIPGAVQLVYLRGAMQNVVFSKTIDLQYLQWWHCSLGIRFDRAQGSGKTGAGIAIANLASVLEVACRYEATRKRKVSNRGGQRRRFLTEKQIQRARQRPLGLRYEL